MNNRLIGSFKWQFVTNEWKLNSPDG
jgi:hypothetical protein